MLRQPARLNPKAAGLLVQLDSQRRRARFSTRPRKLAAAERRRRAKWLPSRRLELLALLREPVEAFEVDALPLAQHAPVQLRHSHVLRFQQSLQTREGTHHHCSLQVVNIPDEGKPTQAENRTGRKGVWEGGESQVFR